MTNYEGLGSATTPSWPPRPTSFLSLFALFVLFLAGVLGPASVLRLPMMMMRLLGAPVGWYLRKQTADRRARLIALMDEKDREARRQSGSLGEKVASNRETEDWDGIVGFFHPFCNAGGGGERVLWAAIRDTQQRWPRAKCVVYTGDHDASKSEILARAKSRFDIDLYAPTITFLYLTTRQAVLAATWPRFTLAGQSLGSIYVAWEAFQLLVPDIFIDTMGYAFALGFAKMLFGASLPTAAYVHYPTISTDMIESLDPESAVGAQGVNAGQGVGLRGTFKVFYWRLFAVVYSVVGATIDVVMTNSSWTQDHIQKLWGSCRSKSTVPAIEVVYPPCPVSEMERQVEVSAASEALRKNIFLVIAQFRPEKNHQLVIEAFAKFLKSAPADVSRDATLVLVGSVRHDADSKRVYQLRLLVNELGIRDRVEFYLNASWPEILDWLRRASVGVNGMWNEHFGIGVVEYQAAGLISVVHDSGGPKLDIVTDVDGEPTGFHATTAEEFARGFERALSLPDPLAMRQRARLSAKRFTEEEFAKKWIVQMQRLIALKTGRAR